MAGCGPVFGWQGFRPFAHGLWQGAAADFGDAFDFPFDQTVGQRSERHDVIDVPEKNVHPTHLLLMPTTVHGGMGIAERSPS